MNAITICIAGHRFRQTAEGNNYVLQDGKNRVVVSKYDDIGTVERKVKKVKECEA